MRCLQIASISNCSFYTSNKDPDTPIFSFWGELDMLLCIWLCGHPSPVGSHPVALGTISPSLWPAGGSASQTSPYPWERKHPMAN